MKCVHELSVAQRFSDPVSGRRDFSWRLGCERDIMEAKRHLTNG
jgi:hypothetical protein